MTTGESGYAEVSVTVKNVGSSTIGFAEVRVKFYNANKTLIGTSSDGIMNLSPNESWDFTLKCLGAGCDQVKSYEITATATSTSAD